MPYVSENEKLRKQLEENTKDRERLQAENRDFEKGSVLQKYRTVLNP
jgi:hypothetical protein